MFIIYVSVRCFRIQPSVIRTESSPLDPAATFSIVYVRGVSRPARVAGALSTLLCVNIAHCRRTMLQLVSDVHIIDYILTTNLMH